MQDAQVKKTGVIIHVRTYIFEMSRMAGGFFSEDLGLYFFP